MNPVLRRVYCALVAVIVVGFLVAAGSAFRIQAARLRSLAQENARLSALAGKGQGSRIVPSSSLDIPEAPASKKTDVWAQVDPATVEAIQEALPFPVEDAYGVVGLGPGAAAVGIEIQKPGGQYRSVWRIDAEKGEVRLVSGPDDVTYGNAQYLSSWEKGFAVTTYRSPGEAVGSAYWEYYDQEGKRLATTFSGDYNADGAVVELSSGSKEWMVELVQDPCVSVGPSYMETGEYGPVPTTKLLALKVNGKSFPFPQPQATRCQLVYGGDYGPVNFWSPEFDGTAFHWDIQGISATVSESGKVAYHVLPVRYDNVAAYTGNSYHPDINNLYRTDGAGEHLVMDVRTDDTIAGLIRTFGDLRLKLSSEAPESLQYTFFAFDDWDGKRPLGKIRFDPDRKVFVDLEME
jgi:hypothetical protein